MVPVTSVGALGTEVGNIRELSAAEVVPAAFFAATTKP
jgi:hypothetical protein